MSESPILAIPEIGENQNNKYITHNNAIKYLEAAVQDKLANTSVGAGPWTLTEDQFTRHFLFVPSGGSGNFNLVTPSTVNGANTKRVFAVRNADTTYTVTVKSAGTGATVDIPKGCSALLSQDHDDVFILALVGANGFNNVYDIGFFVPGQPADDALVFKYVCPAGRVVILLDDFANSACDAGTAPTSTADFDVKLNGSSVGTISISTGGAATFSTTGGAVLLAAGDVLSVEAPSPQDSTLADVSVVFAGIAP